MIREYVEKLLELQNCKTLADNTKMVDVVDKVDAEMYLNQAKEELIQKYEGLKSDNAKLRDGLENAKLRDGLEECLMAFQAEDLLLDEKRVRILLEQTSQSPNKE